MSAFLLKLKPHLSEKNCSGKAGGSIPILYNLMAAVVGSQLADL